MTTADQKKRQLRAQIERVERDLVVLASTVPVQHEVEIARPAADVLGQLNREHGVKDYIVFGSPKGLPLGLYVVGRARGHGDVYAVKLADETCEVLAAFIAKAPAFVGEILDHRYRVLAAREEARALLVH
jgi:hypothetical protein